MSEFVVIDDQCGRLAEDDEQLELGLVEMMSSSSSFSRRSRSFRALLSTSMG